jgi:DNA-directed RNA polymerase specialized sigma subunit
MFIPPGHTEQEVLDIIEKVVDVVSSKFRFGYLDVEDIKQEGALMAIEGMHKFDPNRGYTLDNFLYILVRNGLSNYKRKHYARNDCEDNPQNEVKKKIMNTVDIEREDLPIEEMGVLGGIEHKELLQVIDNKLPMNLRADYLRMTHNVDVPKNKKFKVRQAVLEILKELEDE